MKKIILLPVLTLIALGGCAMQPNQNKIKQLPVIQFGEPVPENGEYILYFQAGKDIPTDIKIGGDIFQYSARNILKVKLKKDIYTYKEWISYDKQHWLDGREQLSVKLDIKIPGYHYPKPGHIKIDLSEKKNAQE